MSNSRSGTAGGMCAQSTSTSPTAATLLGAEQVREDALAVVGVVDEQQQVAQADQRVGVVPGPGQRVGPAVDVTDYVDPHRVNYSWAMRLEVRCASTAFPR
ncbi:MAG: hypothetical protein ACRDRJ_42220 [Streptosporangiaceae bacterium]